MKKGKEIGKAHRIQIKSYREQQGPLGLYPESNREILDDFYVILEKAEIMEGRSKTRSIKTM